MKIELNKPLVRDSGADERDVVRVKRALNRLGYYTQYEKVGITGIPDRALFDALNASVSKAPPGKYIWRTVGDDRVREEHAALEGDVRKWNDSPAPGEEENCRCWAESLPLNNCKEEKEKYIEAQNRVKDLTERFHDLLLQLNELREKNNELIKDAQKSLGVRVLAHILTLPFDRLVFAEGVTMALQKKDKILIATAIVMPFVMLLVNKITYDIVPESVKDWVYEERYRGAIFYLVNFFGASLVLIFLTHLQRWKKVVLIFALILAETPILLIAGVMLSCIYGHACL